MHVPDSILSSLFGFELDEAEFFRLLTQFVSHDVECEDVAERREVLSEFFISERLVQVANVNSFA